VATLNLAAVLEHPARLTPERIAVTFGGDHLTYAELNARADRVAAGLHAIGIRAGDHVALSCPNLPFFPIAYFGILKAGAAVVPLNVLLKPREIAYHLRDSHARAILAFEGTAQLPIGEACRAAAADAGTPHVMLMPRDLPSLMRDDPAFHPPRREPHDTAVILYTSGTTGHPKGAELTHANMAGNAVSCYDMFRPAFPPSPAGAGSGEASGEADGSEQPAMLITLPLFHSTAQTAQMNAGLYGGFRLVLAPRFDPAAVLDLFARERIGLWVGVPTMYWALLQHARHAGIDPSGAAESLRVCVSGGAPMPLEVLREFERVFGVRILEGYGLSETAPVVAFNQLQRPSKPGTVGLPIFGVDVRCFDEHDRAVAPGERGEVVVTHLRSPAFPLIRYRTGDLAALRPGPCPCGRALPVLEPVEGRTADCLVGVDGRVVHALGAIYPLRELSGVRRFQVEQVGPRELVVRIEREAGFADDALPRVREQLERLLGGPVEVRFEFPGEIAAAASGKHRYVIRRVPLEPS
jgi:long-chain acyl-CoA synthetase